LLNEEKEKKQLRRQIAKVEKGVKEAIDTWERQQEDIGMSCGEKVTDSLCFFTNFISVAKFVDFFQI